MPATSRAVAFIVLHGWIRCSDGLQLQSWLACCPGNAFIADRRWIGIMWGSSCTDCEYARVVGMLWLRAIEVLHYLRPAPAWQVDHAP